MPFTCGVCANCRWLVIELYFNILGGQTYLAEFSVAAESESFLSCQRPITTSPSQLSHSTLTPPKPQEKWQMAPKTEVGLQTFTPLKRGN